MKAFTLATIREEWKEFEPRFSLMALLHDEAQLLLNVQWTDLWCEEDKDDGYYDCSVGFVAGGEKYRYTLCCIGATVEPFGGYCELEADKPRRVREEYKIMDTILNRFFMPTFYETLVVYEKEGRAYIEPLKPATDI